MDLLLGRFTEDRHEPSAWARDDFLRVAAPGHVALDLVGPPADHLQVLHPESIELDPRLPATARTGSTGSGGPGVERNRSTRRAGPTRSHAAHRRILEAIQRRDEGVAHRSMLDHLIAVETLVTSAQGLDRRDASAHRKKRSAQS